MNKPPIVRTTRATAEPTHIPVIGTRENVCATIDHLCTLGFCVDVSRSETIELNGANSNLN